MSLRRTEEILCQAAETYCSTGEKKSLLMAAWHYGKARIKNANNRDRWKEKKRLNESLRVKA